MELRKATFVLIFVVTLPALLAPIAGCKKKVKPQPVAQAPSLPTPPPLPLPEVKPPEPVQPETNVQMEPEPEPKPEPKKKPRRNSRASYAKSANGSVTASETTLAKTVPPRITVDAGSVPSSSGAISAASPHTPESDRRKSTSELLEATEANLKSISRTLSNEEASLASQIHAFMAQSKTATLEGDAVRAYNLALKAHLLSDELVKR